MYESNTPGKITSFTELTKQVHLINDLILADMTCEDADSSKQAVTFSKHLLATKYWFARVSYANKKGYLLALLHDIRSAWALSLLLKSMWNCRPKDAVLSVNEHNVYTSYDQAPLDHNRTALPVHTLAKVMKNDRIWFLSLDPESQALVLSELMTVAGGPAMWEALRLARHIFECNHDLMLKNIQECIVVNDTLTTIEKPKVDQPKSREGGLFISGQNASSPGEAQKALDAALITWNATIKAMRDSLKLEELEMKFNDGTKRKMWKVNRIKPEVIETVDFVQMLPSAIGKRILSYLPFAQLADYGKVNKYWQCLVDELKAELAARTKIDADFEKLHELLLRHDVSLEVFIPPNEQVPPPSSLGASVAPSTRARQVQPSIKASEKSAGAYSLRHFMSEKLGRPLIIQKPIRNMADLSERLERRGAADENIWKWCDCVLAHAKKIKKFKQRTHQEQGVLTLGNVHFPCPLMKVSMELPLVPPLYKDPIMSTSAKPKKNLSECNFVNAPKEITKRYSLWTRDLSTLYRVYKVPSYLNPETPLHHPMPLGCAPPVLPPPIYAPQGRAPPYV